MAGSPAVSEQRCCNCTRRHAAPIRYRHANLMIAIHSEDRVDRDAGRQCRHDAHCPTAARKSISAWARQRLDTVGMRESAAAELSPDARLYSHRVILARPGTKVTTRPAARAIPVRRAIVTLSPLRLGETGGY